MHPQTLQTWPRGEGHWLPEPTICFEIMGKSTFSQNWSDNDAKKNRLQDLYDVFDLHV